MNKKLNYRIALKLNRPYQYLGQFLFILMCIATIIAICDLFEVLPIGIGYEIDIATFVSSIYLGPLIGFAAFSSSIPTRVAYFYPSDLLHLLGSDV